MKIPKHFQKFSPSTRATLERMIGKERREIDAMLKTNELLRAAANRSIREMFPPSIQEKKVINKCHVCDGQGGYSGREDWTYCYKCDGKGTI